MSFRIANTQKTFQSVTECRKELVGKAIGNIWKSDGHVQGVGKINIVDAMELQWKSSEMGKADCNKFWKKPFDISKVK